MAEFQNLSMPHELLFSYQHVIPHHSKRTVRGAGNSRNTFTADSKEAAIKLVRDIARNQKSELVIHDKRGRIIDKDSYGNDPFPLGDRVG